MKLNHVLFPLLVFMFFGCKAQPASAVNNILNAVSIPYKETSYGEPRYSKTYFLPQQTGKLSVTLKLRSGKDCSLLIQLDSTGKTYTVNIKHSTDLINVPVGEFAIDRIGYHFISVKCVHDDFYLPEIDSVIVSGDAAKDIKFNSSEYRGAPATHLSYKVPGDTAVAMFYSEIKVPQEAESMNAYYMTNGFSGGYMGIQINSSTERRVLFSIWSDYETNNPNEIPAEYAVKLVRKGANVHSGEFGNEGSGGQTYLQFNWKANTVYKLLVSVKASGNHTIYTGYFYDPAAGKWMLIGEWDKPKTNGKLLSGLYSFVENFGDNGADLFKAYYGNQWIKTPSGNWIELTNARFTTTADPVKHPRFDYGGGANGNWFYMFSGGFQQANVSKYGDAYTRNANSKVPDVTGLP